MQYSASLAAYVAAWECYLEQVVGDYYSLVFRPADVAFMDLKAILEQRNARSVSRFNTPNAATSRTLLFECTGYDPINDWNWPRRRLGGLATRSLLDDVVRIRHTFAHGAPLPGYWWNRSRAGTARLSTNELDIVEGLLSRLVEVTDRNLSMRLRDVYALTGGWY